MKTFKCSFFNVWFLIFFGVAEATLNVHSATTWCLGDVADNAACTDMQDISDIPQLSVTMYNFNNFQSSNFIRSHSYDVYYGITGSSDSDFYIKQYTTGDCANNSVYFFSFKHFLHN